jgi:hypothetical protein
MISTCDWRRIVQRVDDEVARRHHPLAAAIAEANGVWVERRRYAKPRSPGYDAHPSSRRKFDPLLKARAWPK